MNDELWRSYPRPEEIAAAADRDPLLRRQLRTIMDTVSELVGQNDPFVAIGGIRECFFCQQISSDGHVDDCIWLTLRRGADTDN